MATRLFLPHALDDVFLQEQNKLLGELYSATDISAKMKFAHPYLATVITVYKQERCSGRVAVYYNPEIHIQNKKTFLLGKYECINDAETSATLLQTAWYWIKDQGGECVVGPMDGSTWNTYRFCVEQKGPLFFTEPVHKEYYAQQFSDFGFKTLAEYISSKQTEFHALDERAKNRMNEFVQNGVVFRNISTSHFEEDLKKIYRLCSKAFSGNFLYSSITEKEFVEMYLAVKPVLNENLVLLAEYKNEVVGFVFGLDNVYDRKKKGCVVKTLARDNNPKFKGIGNVLSGMFTENALNHGYEYILHALMIHDNASVKVSQNYHGNKVSGYRLFYKEI